MAIDDYFGHRNQALYSSIGYLVVVSAYLEECIENTYTKILQSDTSDKSIPQLLDEINKVISTQSNAAAFQIARTKIFFKNRNQAIHGQLYGQINSDNLFLTHRRKNIIRKPTSLNEYETLLKEAKYLLRKWQVIQRVKPT